MYKGNISALILILPTNFLQKFCTSSYLNAHSIYSATTVWLIWRNLVSMPIRTADILVDINSWIYSLHTNVGIVPHNRPWPYFRIFLSSLLQIVPLFKIRIYTNLRFVYYIATLPFFLKKFSLSPTAALDIDCWSISEITLSSELQ